MNEKEIETKPEDDFGLNIHYHQEDESTDNIDNLDEDIPFPENWKRYDLNTIKQYFSDWLDYNLQHEYKKDPEFYLSDSVNEKRFYFRLIEHGYTNEDPDPDDEGYRCVFVPFETKQVEDLDD